MKDDGGKCIVIRIEIQRRQLVWALAIALVAGTAGKLLADTLTTTTYYPSPAGVYQKLTTTGPTVLARDGGALVGVGTTGPVAKLDVQGLVRSSQGFLMVPQTADPPSPQPGQIWMRAIP